MRNIDENTITQAVVESMAGCRDHRLRDVMTSLVQHLHSFAREVKLTEAEWAAGIAFLTAAGKITDDKRQEFILLSDVLGLSTLVTAQNNAKPIGCTESTVFGPFYVEGAPTYENGADIANGAKGAPCFIAGHVRALDGTPVADVSIDVWQSDEDGFYDVQSSGEQRHRARGTLQEPKPTAASASVPSLPRRIPFRMMVRSARCWRRWGDIPGGPRTCTSCCASRATRRW